MQADALLTQDELDFIQSMQHSPQLNLADSMSSCWSMATVASRAC